MRYPRVLFEHLPADAPDELIETTAVSLERHPYTPLMLLDVPGFLRMRKGEVLAEYDRLVALGPEDPELMAVNGQDPAVTVERQLGLLLYHYGLLCRLRLSDAEAWDVVHELYEDD